MQTASATQVRKKMYQGSSEAWKDYELYLEPMLGGLRNPTGSITDNLIKAYQSGEMAHVESEARELLDRYPDSEMVLNILGASLQSQGKVEGALEVYDRAIKSNPKFAEAHNNKGNALKELGRGAEALTVYEHAVEIAPKFFK